MINQFDGVSIVIPCYNAGKYLAKAVNSTKAQLGVKLELIIVNDGSNDPQTLTLLDDLSRKGVRVIHSANQGLPSARNLGITFASSEYILCLDPDDLIHPEYAIRAVQAFVSNPELGIVYGRSVYFGTNSGPCGFPQFNEVTMLHSVCIQSAAFFRKSLWKKVGGFSDDFRKGFEDWDFWLTLIEEGAKVYCINEIMWFYRRHSSNVTNSINADAQLQIELYDKLVCRHDSLYASHYKDVISYWAGEYYKSQVKIDNMLEIRLIRLIKRVFSRIKSLFSPLHRGGNRL